NPGTTYQSAGDPSRPASAPATATAHIAAASTWKARIRSSIPNGTKCAPTTSSVHTGESSGASREVCSSRLPTAIRATSTAITRPNQPGCGRGGAVSVPPAGSGARSTETRTPAPATRNPPTTSHPARSRACCAPGIPSPAQLSHTRPKAAPTSAPMTGMTAVSRRIALLESRDRRSAALFRKGRLLVPPVFPGALFFRGRSSAAGTLSVRPRHRPVMTGRAARTGSGTGMDDGSGGFPGTRPPSFPPAPGRKAGSGQELDHAHVVVVRLDHAFQDHRVLVRAAPEDGAPPRRGGVAGQVLPGRGVSGLARDVSCRVHRRILRVVDHAAPVTAGALLDQDPPAAFVRIHRCSPSASPCPLPSGTPPGAGRFHPPVGRCRPGRPGARAPGRRRGSAVEGPGAEPGRRAGAGPQAEGVQRRLGRGDTAVEGDLSAHARGGHHVPGQEDAVAADDGGAVAPGGTGQVERTGAAARGPGPLPEGALLPAGQGGLGEPA